MADIAQKWTCEKCTYENFPASSRCVVCGHSGRFSSSSGVDIYNLCQPPQTKPTTATSDSNKEDSAPLEHWICSACTLLNAVWLDRCAACTTRRDGIPNTSTTTSQTVKSNSSSSPPSRSPRSAFTNYSGATTPRLASFLPRWRCPNCTYDNYPKSQKCTMCQRPKSATTCIESSNTPRGVVEQLPSALGGSTPDSISPHTSPQGSVLNLNEACGNTALFRQQSQGSEAPPKQSSSSSCAASASYSLPENLRRQTSPSLPSASSPSTLFINACKSVRDGLGDDAINLFLLYGGDPRQKLTADDIHQILDGAMACDVYVGQTLIDLAVTYKRESVLKLLLNAVESLHSQQTEHNRRKTLTSPRRRCVLPCQLCPDLAADVRFLFGAGLRQAKETAFPCYYFARDPVTFSLPVEVYSISAHVRKQLLEDIVDHQVQNELEGEGVLNWSAEVVFNLGSRLYSLCNRAAGDCLLDSVMQTMWGVMDRSNVLRRAMASALYEAEHAFSQCWRSYETSINERLGFTLDESQWDATWQKLLELASSQGQSLEELHIFVLAHVLRRPIIVYSPNFIRSRVSGDKIGESSFQGVYLPLLWDRQFCHRNPIALAYTLGHFSALVAIQSAETTVDPRGSGERAIYLPLQDSEGKLFPVHFSPSRTTSTRRLLTDWLDCWKTCRTNMLVAQQRLDPPPLAVRQMLGDWLSRYSSTAVLTAPESASISSENELPPSLASTENLSSSNFSPSSSSSTTSLLTKTSENKKSS